jgi:hypothetical protein
MELRNGIVRGLPQLHVQRTKLSGLVEPHGSGKPTFASKRRDLFRLEHLAITIRRQYPMITELQ